MHHHLSRASLTAMEVIMDFNKYLYVAGKVIISQNKVAFFHFLKKTDIEAYLKVHSVVVCAPPRSCTALCELGRAADVIAGMWGQRDVLYILPVFMTIPRCSSLSMSSQCPTFPQPLFSGWPYSQCWRCSRIRTSESQTETSHLIIRYPLATMNIDFYLTFWML